MEHFIRLLRFKYVINVLTLLVFILLFIFFAGSGVPVLLNKYKDLAEYNVDANILKSDNISLDVQKTLNELNEHEYKNCDETLVYRMRTAQFKSAYIKDIGFTKDNMLICTTGLGLLEKPFKEPKPQFTTPNGFDVWFNVPIKLFDFQQVGTVTKKENFNTVINASDLTMDNNKEHKNTIFLQKNAGDITYLQGSKDLKQPANKDIAVWYNHTGFYSFKCSESSIICAMSFIPMSYMIKKELRLILGVVLLSLLSSIFISISLKKYLKKLTKLRNRLLRNLNTDKIVCFYQPVVRLSDHKTIGCEVLARWQDDDGSIVTPDKFLHIIRGERKTELFTSLIIDKAFDELADVIKHYQTFKIAFNIFPIDFSYDSVQSALSRYRRAYPDLQINIELTEDELVEAPAIAEHINKLREENYIVSIDDFGTGYSSLSYLQEIKVDFIKIDRSFVRDLEIGTVKSQLIPHIVSIAETINARIIVEGVENDQQLNYMKSLGVDLAQGYYFSKPIPVDEFKIFIS